MLDNIGKTIADLDQKVNAFTKNEDLLIEKKSNIPAFNTKLIVYFVIPIILLVIFMFSKPSFIMKDEIVDNVVISSKIDFIKMTIIIIIISLPSNFFIHKKFIKE
jgi:hypothetical protein